MLAAHDEFQVELVPLPSSADEHGDGGEEDDDDDDDDDDDVCELCTE